MYLLIGLGVLIVLIVIASGYLGMDAGSGTISILGIFALVIIIIVLLVHYVGKSAQTMNPPPNGSTLQYREADGSTTIVWEGTYPDGYMTPGKGWSKEPPPDYPGTYDPEADRKYLYGR